MISEMMMMMMMMMTMTMMMMLMMMIMVMTMFALLLYTAMFFIPFLFFVVFVALSPGHRSTMTLSHIRQPGPMGP